MTVTQEKSFLNASQLDDLSSRWDLFIVKQQSRWNVESGESFSVQAPYAPIETLATKYLKETVPLNILDIGCELGKNAIPFLERGDSVTILDVSPAAIEHTTNNLKHRGLFDRVVDVLNVSIESLPDEYGSYDAVVGTYVFSFISPEIFEDVMKANVLGRVKPGGYFAGGFFGKKHGWAKDESISISTEEEIRDLFSSMNFTILDLESVIKEGNTVSNGVVAFHDIRVIAQRQFQAEE
jgi:SAM-dependent methyltransferase